MPKPVLPHSIASPSLVAGILYQKYDMGIPLARQERDWYRIGLGLYRSTMSGWVIRSSEEWLYPIYERMHQAMMGCSVLLGDETRIQCNIWRMGDFRFRTMNVRHPYDPSQTDGRHGCFADTPKGAWASGIVYSLVESAKLNHLDVFRYLAYLLKEMPEIDYQYLKKPGDSGRVSAVVRKPARVLQAPEKEEMSCYGNTPLTAHFLQYGFFCITYVPYCFCTKI